MTGAAQMVTDHDESFAAFWAAAAALTEDRFESGLMVDMLIHTSGINPYVEHGDQIKEWRQPL